MSLIWNLLNLDDHVISTYGPACFSPHMHMLRLHAAKIPKKKDV
jgi:hypothetical protein